MKLKKFNSLNKAQKRVAVAKDVLKHLDEMRIVTGSYVTIDLNDLYVFGKSLSKAFPKIRSDCEVCAIGACFLSIVGIVDNIGATKIDWGYDKCDMIDHLKLVFSQNQIGLIETAFEKRIIDDNYKSYRGLYDAVVFGLDYDNDKDRLRAIMKNIVKNGIFKPKIRELA